MGSTAVNMQLSGHSTSQCPQCQADAGTHWGSPPRWQQGRLAWHEHNFEIQPEPFVQKKPLAEIARRLVPWMDGRFKVGYPHHCCIQAIKYVHFIQGASSLHVNHSDITENTTGRDCEQAASSKMHGGTDQKNMWHERWPSNGCM